MRALLILALASCTHDLAVFDQIDVKPARDLDILYVFDNSAGRGTYDQMASQLGVLQARLADAGGRLPNLHIGLVTTDLGTRGRLDPQAGPPIGRCAGDGDAGKLVTFQAGPSFGAFLEDLQGPGGTRTRNFDSSLATAVARLTNPPAGTANTGCEVAQPLEAMRRALDPATNPDFIRPGALLSIVFLTNQDDCSLARSALLDPFDTALGPSLPFRCTEQGVICDGDDPRRPGPRTGCRPRAGSPFLVDVAEYQRFLAGQKADPRDIAVSAVAGPRGPFEVKGAGAPVLAPSCQGAGGSAQPAVRIGALVDAFGGALIDGCTQDAAYQQITAPVVTRQRSCFPNLRRADGEDCTVIEATAAGEVEVARCAAGGPAPCWYTYADAAACPGGDHVGIAINRGDGIAPAQLADPRDLLRAMTEPLPILRIEREASVTKLAALACIMIACGGTPKEPAAHPTPALVAVERPPAAKDGPAGAPRGDRPASLYERLGGKPAIAAVTGEFLARVGADARIKLRFLNTDLGKLNTLLVEFVCMATGGPCKYTGQDMETSHAGMELVDDEFTALVEDLAGALDKLSVPAREKGELLGALGPLQPQIVTPASRLKPVDEAAIARATAVAVRITDGNAAELLQAAIVAAKRGQRNYADQLFSRVEAIVGAKAVAAAAPTFRDGAPPRIDTPLKRLPRDTPPQPAFVGNSDDDQPDGKRPASLTGTLTVAGRPLDGLGTVMLSPVNGVTKKRRPKQRLVEQRDKTFLPHVLAVPPGSTVAFPNFDGIFHNVFSISPTKRFDVGLYKDGDTRELKFEKPGIVRLGCNIHAKMSAYILVVDAPHYVVVDGANRFNFRSLAPGRYKVRAWSERSAAPAESEIVIKPGVNTATFDVAGDATGGPGEDKFGMTRQPVAAAR